jgi:hypothetical protein
VDQRLVQTAVVDGPDSEEPVILPEDHRAFDEFGSFYSIARSGAARYSVAVGES